MGAMPSEKAMEILLALLPGATYAFVSSITPGPNNIMLTASGITFGFKRTVPHILGIPFGFGVLLALCAVGIGALLVSVPSAEIGLKVFGTTYMLYLAWMLRKNALGKKESATGETEGKPMTFWQAAMFQFANPKAWVFALTGASAFMPNYPSLTLSVAVLVVLFCTINLPCVATWAILGSTIKRYLQNPILERIFSTLIVLLTIYAAIAIWL
ncbi:MAG: threonine/homoserine/homoserine lactone efflux protein [Candidatus Promineifilaceae bacterium]|jgi:threonine/homoserine/homoserine lactone efflux protein